LAALALRRRATVNGYAWFAPKMVWTRHNTWPTKATGTDLKSEGQRVAVESVDIAVETLEVKAVYAISARIPPEIWKEAGFVESTRAITSRQKRRGFSNRTNSRMRLGELKRVGFGHRPFGDRPAALPLLRHSQGVVARRLLAPSRTWSVRRSSRDIDDFCTGGAERSLSLPRPS
jgi:hypothetical protein